MRQRHTAPQHGTGGAHRGGRDRGLGQHATAQQDGNRVGIDRVMLCLAPRDRLHGEGMAQDERHAFVRAQVGEPLPDEHTCDGDNETISIRGHGVEQGVRIRLHIPVKQCRTGLVEDADVHGTGMQVNAAGKRVLCGVKSP